MADAQGAERACKDPSPVIDGRKSSVNLAYLGAKPRSMQEGDHSHYNNIVYLLFVVRPDYCY